MENAVALRFRLEPGVVASARGFTHTVPPRRLPLAAANSRPKPSNIELNIGMPTDSQLDSEP